MEASRSLAARSIQLNASRKSDKHIAKLQSKLHEKAETKSFISANQSRSMTDTSSIIKTFLLYCLWLWI